MNKLLKCFISVIALLITSLVLTGCINPSNDPLPLDNPTINITTQEYTILEGIYETKVHIFKSNVKGPKVAIVGGIHGDEIAGWKVALKLLEKNDFRGEVLIIPRANYLATTLEQRYPGSNNNGLYEEILYSDLNRVFPGKIDGTVTEQIAYAIVQEINKFNPTYMIDLHESKGSYIEGKRWIGDEVIYGNKKSSLFVGEIVDQFNENYLVSKDVPFAADNNAPEGSFNYFYGNNYDAYVFTIETNRNLNLNKRIEQQEQLLNIFFKLIWDL